MNLINVKFNRNPLYFGKSMEQPSITDVKNTFSLWNASLDDAIKYGGEVTRAALQTMNLRHDRKYIIVDSKVHMLMKGMSPAIPGWHVDGAPRNALKNPQGTEAPNTFAQEGDQRPNRYHILVTGKHCLTAFLNVKNIEIPIPDKPSYDIYHLMSSYVHGLVTKDESLIKEIPSCTAVEFDWWDIHTGIIAKEKEWRYLIRVCESDYYEPQKDLREVIRLQSQVYSPFNFSW